MSSNKFNFDEETKKKVRDWIAEKCQGLSCEACHKSSWLLGNDIVMPIIFNGNINIGGPVYPQAMLICTNCGNTKYFNIALMGLVNKENKGEGSEK